MATFKNQFEKIREITTDTQYLAVNNFDLTRKIAKKFGRKNSWNHNGFAVFSC